MAVTWTYPWSFLGERAPGSIDGLAARGVEAVNVASHYHSIQTLDPRRSDGRFESYPGGCYFEPSARHFAETPISPSVNEVAGSADPLGDIVTMAGDAGMTVNAWFVCNHNSRLGAENPDFRFESAFGTAHDHALCPSHPEVREYLGGVARSLAEYDIGEIQLESLGFPNAFHGHGAAFGHDKDHVATDAAQELLLSQCFCSGCRAAAADHPVDFDRAARVVREQCERVLSGPGESVDVRALREARPVVDDLFDFRARVVEALVRRLAEASGDVGLNYYVADGLGRDPGDGRPAGIDLGRLEPHLDRVTALCYVSDPSVARRRIDRASEAVDVPTDAGVSMDPSLVADEDEWQRLVSAVRERCSRVHVYNYTLLSEDHLDWFDATFG